jgi:hypothetical protein
MITLIIAYLLGSGNYEAVGFEDLTAVDMDVAVF